MAFLVDDILFAPINATIWLADKIKDEVNKKMFDVDAIRKSMEELQERHDRGELMEEEFIEAEARLLESLAAAKRFEKEGGVG
jgi:hypothetical protein